MNKSSLEHLFQNNRDWVAEVTVTDPEYFSRLADQQAPRYFWIGCSDSRVPANQITGLAPGEVFVHRNVANVVVHSDLNCLSVLQFAVDVLEVEHVMVVGHYGCGGVQAAMNGVRVGLADNWLKHVQDVRDKHGAYLGSVLDARERHDRLCELNAIEQVVNICHTTIVQDAWERGQSLEIHGFVYGLKDGMLRDLDMNVTGMSQLAERYDAARKRIGAL
ncbi:MAG: carbonate dehydratase [Candidatus Protistobacter heckmanni]|nr:carbonate dehydratase [Candidatus Protistobacter heckmanni]